MRKRDRLQNRVRTLFAPNVTNPASAQQTLSSPVSQSSLATSGQSAQVTTTSRNLALEKALVIHLQKIPDAEKAACVQASKTIDERTQLSNVRAHDVAHKDSSSFRPHAERLSKFLDFLNRFMGGVAIGIQANPEISAVVVGAVRIVIDLAMKFTTFFSRLIDMVCTFEDYLGPLAEYAQAADIELVGKTVVNAYKNVLDFAWKARRVFVDDNGDPRRWTSFRTFIRQHWETFESEFLSIKEDMQHHLDVLLHSVQALQFDAVRKAEYARQHGEESRFNPLHYQYRYLINIIQGKKGPRFYLGFQTSTLRKPIRITWRRSRNRRAIG
jgi:hypothetical protein